VARRAVRINVPAVRWHAGRRKRRSRARPHAALPGKPPQPDGNRSVPDPAPFGRGTPAYNTLNRG